MGKLEDREKRRRSAVSGIVTGTKSDTAKEKKQRVCLALKPSLYADLQKVGYMQRKSASKIVDELIEKYVEENKELLEEYHDIASKRP